jgi:hypothetical protein
MATRTAGPGQAMSRGNPIKVTVIADIDPKTQKVRWNHEWEFEGKPGKYKGKIDVAEGDWMVPIAFHLRDATGLRLKFYADPAQAMYVGPAPACPPPQGNGGQIIFPPSAAPHLLRVRDENSGDPIDLKYALRFDGDPNPAGGEAAPYVYDPDLKNGGGGIPLTQ